MKSNTHSTIINKSGTALAVVAIALGFMLTGIHSTEASTTGSQTYLIDTTGNGCGNSCTELQNYLSGLNSNTSSQNSTGTNTSNTNGSNGTSGTGTGNGSNTSGNNSDNGYNYVQYPYQKYAYFVDPSPKSYADTYSYTPYPQPIYVYYGGKSASDQIAAYQQSVGAQTLDASSGTSYQTPVTNAGFVLTSSN